jgi:NAD-dependent DNA ligase
MNTATTNDLVSKIREANEAYRTGNPIMSDPEYDAMIEELAKVDPEHELLGEVGYIASDDSRKEPLPFPMMSMNKVKTEDEVLKWITKHGLENEDFVLSPKYDGNSLAAHESKMLAWTRGDGTNGQRSHEHFKAFKDTPLNEDVYTFGETIMPRARFDEKYAEDEENPRNTVGGIMNKETVTDKTYDVDYVRYGMFYEDKDLSDVFPTKSMVFDYLNERQDNSVMYNIFTKYMLTADELKRLFEEWNEKYEIDGIIIEVNNLKRQEEIGRERNGNPAFARAYKGDFEEVSGETPILEIISQISKKGFLFPVMVIPPTRLDGATVTRVTGNNFKFIKDNGLGVGAVITLKRSGMVIPKVVEVIKTVDFVMPDVGVPVGWDEGGVHIVTLEETDEQRVQFIASFFKILGVDNVSEGTCQMMFDYGMETVKEILEATKADFEDIKRFGERRAEIVFTEIQKKMKSVELSKLQHASGCFDNLGSKKLILLEHLENPSLREIVSIEGFSDTSAHAYIDGLEKYNEFIADLGDLVTVNKTEIKEASSSDMADFVFVFTGVRRKDLEEIILDKGGKIASGVSAKITHLVCKDPGAGSSKIKKAESLDKAVINVEQLEALLK